MTPEEKTAIIGILKLYFAYTSEGIPRDALVIYQNLKIAKAEFTQTHEYTGEPAEQLVMLIGENDNLVVTKMLFGSLVIEGSGSSGFNAALTQEDVHLLETRNPGEYTIYSLSISIFPHSGNIPRRRFFVLPHSSR
jgi:hypothetical protein